MNYLKTIEENLSQKLKAQLQHHKERAKKIFYSRYKELLPNLIKYKNADATSIDFLKVEVALRNNYNVVIGETKDGNLMVIGYVNNAKSSEDPSDFLYSKPLTKDDINFIVPVEKLPEKMSEISHIDDCQTGNFVVLKNKILNYIHDDVILQHFIDSISEIELSRLSIAMQAKINTIFLSEVNDESINQLISEVYAGSPYIKLSKHFDPNEHILRVDNEHMATNFNELKREFQNKISENNNLLGINSLAVEKESGTSDTEAKSNRAFVTANANIYLLGRNKPLSKLNKRYGLNIEAIYNDEVESELMELEKEKEEILNNENNNNNL